MPKKAGLGRGLEALFTDNASADTQQTELRVSEIEPNKNQPRRDFNDDSLRELAESIRRHGVLQPLLVRPLPGDGGGYQIVAGERRWRASRLAGLTYLPAKILELSDEQSMEIALIENLQREDLNPMEEALGYKMLMSTYKLTQDDVANRVGKGRSTVANALRLLALPGDISDMLAHGQLSAGHARAILAIAGDEEKRLAAKAAAAGASVRDIEKMAQARRPEKESPESGAGGTKQNRPRAGAKSADNFYREAELALTGELGRKVRITAAGKGGSIAFDFYSEDDLRGFLKEMLAR